MHQNISIMSNEVDHVRSLRKFLTQLRGTNFCTSSARFAASFVWQPNGPECTQMVRNAPKHQHRVQWGGSGAFLAENSDATSCMNFSTSSARFAPSFIRQPNGPECTQIVRNAPKRQFRWIRGVHCEKFRHDFVARTFALVRLVLHRVS